MMRRSRRLYPIGSCVGLGLTICTTLALFPHVVWAQEACRVELRQEAVLGEIEDEGSVRVPYHAVIAEVPWGGWVVAEDRNEVIQYGPDASFMDFIGRRGQGPGELQSPMTITVDPTDSVWVSDVRGRAVIYGPDGAVGRTLVSPRLGEVHGFTPDGMPYSGYSSYDVTREPLVPAYFVRVWNREGEPLGEFGRDTVATRGFREFSIFGPEGSGAGEGEFLYPARYEDGLVVRFVENGYRVDLGREEVAARIGVAGDALSAVDVRSVDDGFLVIVLVRILAEEEENELAREVGRVPGYDSSPSLSVRRRMPQVMNATWEGRLVHVRSDGTVAVSPGLDHAPFGFSADDQVYGFVEDEDTGMIRVVITEFSTRCSG